MNRVRRWLTQEQFILKVTPDLKADLNIEVAFGPNDWRRVNVAFPKKVEDVISLQTGMELSDYHAPMFGRLTQQEKTEFLWDLRLALVAYRVSFDVPPEPKPNYLVHVWKYIYFDGLTKNLFMDALNEVYLTVTLAQLKIIQKFGWVGEPIETGLIGWRG